MTAWLGVAITKPNTTYPVALASGKARLLVFRIKCSRFILEQRPVYVLECVDVDDGIQFPINLARDEGNDTTPRANVELGRLGSKRIARNILFISHYYGKPTSGARGPHASVLGAEGTGAGPRGNLGWFGFPQQLERDISAVAASGNEQDRFLCVRFRRLTNQGNRRPPRCEAPPVGVRVDRVLRRQLMAHLRDAADIRDRLPEQAKPER